MGVIFLRTYIMPAKPKIIHIAPQSIQSNNVHVVDESLIGDTMDISGAGGAPANIKSFSLIFFFTSGERVVSGLT